MTVQESALGLGVLELERLWPAPVVRRRYQAGARGRQEPRSTSLEGVCIPWSKIGSADCFLVSYYTLAKQLGLKLKTSAELLDFGAASLTVNS